MTIKELRCALDSREISAAELTKGYLAGIAELNPQIGAYLHVNEELALSMAEKAQKRIDAGESAPLTGIPIGIKDLLCTTDMPTTCASKLLEGYIPPYDATIISNLRTQDTVLIGKINMDEFAMGSSNMNSGYFPVKNPYDLNRVPGGSSGGSAAAVAANLCAGALGSDTGGSIRQPASFCGVTGLRPTYGLVSRFGCVAFASSLDQVGPLAQSAEDCGIILDAIASYDPKEMTSARERSGRPATDSLKGLKLGLIEELMGSDVEAQTKSAVEAAARWYEAQGAIVERISLPMLKYGVPAYYLISAAEASANLSRFDGVRYGQRSKSYTDYQSIVEKTRGEGFGWEVKRRILLGAYALCSGYYDAYYKKAVQLAHVVREEYRKALEQFDALLSPVSPDVAFRFDNAPTDPAQGYIADICTVSAPLAGLPALSTPCGYNSEGMPIGLMITGKRFDDKFILSLASHYEREFKKIPAEVRA
ncbi:MAG: Asp-tRNA(Asn)/Glu-tRNA(Gln) amidotransferase subunit GatA [Oscillospiraceae bacterium]|jgi:aspartyl-tRNA(Asn)/glutamyl-tRNA(Gln) amidotransferase subunit A|nr:Asp-tRNA(Asn)/Glu-tRNA(Gln) amidotransferase subunit GatA [Oscillospiraceae bacterium]